jgi:N-acetylglucosamine-6-phosphate deacetylase
MKPSGFIDLQVNGYGGVDFSKPGLTLDAVRQVADTLRKQGTAGFCPTVCTAPETVLRENLTVLGAACEDAELEQTVLGIHLEGPFLSLESRGAHPLDCLRRPDLDFMKRCMDWASGHIRLLTLAPELDGAPTVIEWAVGQGIRVSLGHHMAGQASLTAAVRAGAVACTHLGNGISPNLPRHPNPLWMQLAEDALTAMFITDGHHLPPDYIKVAWRAKGPDRFIVVSDVSPLAGLPPGAYRFLGGDCRVMPDGRIVSADERQLAGSASTLLACMNNLSSQLNLDEETLWRVGFHNPLKLLGETESRVRHLPAPVCFENGVFAITPPH